MAVVTVATDREARLVGPGETTTALGEFLSLLEVPHEFAIGRELDGSKHVRLQFHGGVCRGGVARLIAEGLYRVFVQAFQPRNALGLEVTLDHGNGLIAVRIRRGRFFRG